MKMRMRTVTSALAMIIAAGGGHSALAQEAQSADAASSTTTLETIIVTAQKRAQDLQDVASSVTALTGEQLEARGIVDVTTLSTAVPGFNFARSGSDARPAVRGVRTEEIDAPNDPVVGFFIDGIYKPRTSQALAGFIDSERVEVLRGPQGTLFGRNTYAGLVNIISKLPVDAVEGGGSLQYGNYNDIRIEGIANMPLTSNTAIRVVGLWQKSDGYVEVEPSRTATGGQAEDFNDNDQWYVRGILKSDITDNVQLIARLSHWDQGGYGAGGYGYTVAGTLRDSAGVLDLGGTLDRNNPRTNATLVNGSRVPSDDDPYHVYRNTANVRETTETSGNIELNVDVAGLAFKSLTAYSDFQSYRVNDDDYSEADASVLELDTSSESFSQELQIGSADKSALEWIAGAYYFYESAVDDFWFNRGRTGAFTYRQIVKTNSYALFAQATYAVAEPFRITLGGRYTWDDKHFEYESPVGTADTTPEDEVYKKFTWKAGLEFDLTSDNMLYATVSTGFRSGGFNNSGAVASYGPQTATAYEAGIKNRFPDQNLILNLVGFYNDYNDILASTYVCSNQPACTTTVVARDNGGSSRAYGAEAELTWEPIEAFTVNATAAWLNAKYQDFRVALPSGYTLATGYTIVTQNGARLLDLSGNTVPNSPELTFGVGGTYKVELGEAGSITPEVRFFWSDSYYVNEFNYDNSVGDRDVGRQRAFTKTNLRLTWLSASEMLSVAAFVDNLEDEAVLTRSVHGGQGAIFQNYNPPRTFGIKAGVKF